MNGALMLFSRLSISWIALVSLTTLTAHFRHSRFNTWPSSCVVMASEKRNCLRYSGVNGGDLSGGEGELLLVARLELVLHVVGQHRVVTGVAEHVVVPAGHLRQV